MVLSTSAERDWTHAKPSSPAGRRLSPERSIIRAPRGAPHAAFDIKNVHEYALFAAVRTPETQPPDTRHRNDNQQSKRIPHRIEDQVMRIKLPARDKRLMHLVKERARHAREKRHPQAHPQARRPTPILRPERRSLKQEEALHEELVYVRPAPHVSHREERRHNVASPARGCGTTCSRTSLARRHYSLDGL